MGLWSVFVGNVFLWLSTMGRINRTPNFGSNRRTTLSGIIKIRHSQLLQSHVQIVFGHSSKQRLEQPEYCPIEYYALMLRCWEHDPSKRPKFYEIYDSLPDMKPEQVITITAFGEPIKDHLMYRQNEIITVLDKPANSTFWKGVMNSGKLGMFDPSNTVTYLGNSLPSSINRDTFMRNTERTSSKRKLCPEMISAPQNDLKHTGHIGLHGECFGDVSFLSSSSNPPPSVCIAMPYYIYYFICVLFSFFSNEHWHYHSHLFSVLCVLCLFVASLIRIHQIISYR